MALWRKPNLVKPNEAEWIADRFADFVTRFGEDWFENAPLILPTLDFFSAPSTRDHETALIVFGQIKAHLGLNDDWPVRLEPHESAPGAHQVADTVMIQHSTNPIGGTFSIDEIGPVVTYDPDTLNNSRLFITTIFHELAHYMMIARPSPDESFPDHMLEEMATDILVITAGAGVLKLETAFVAEAGQDAYSQGWRIGLNGYISAEFAAFSLALFLRLRAIDPKLAEPHLSRTNLKRLHTGLAQIDNNPYLLDDIM